MADMHEVLQLLEKQGAAFEIFKKNHDDRLARLEADFLDSRRPPAGAPDAAIKTSRELGKALRAAMLGDDRELKDMAMNDDPAGGYLVVPQMDDAIRTIRDQVSPISALAREIVLDEGGEVLLPRTNGTLTTAWIGETSARPETPSLDVGLDRIALHEVYACPSVTQKLLDTANYDIGTLLTEQIGHALATAEGIAIHGGDGVARPRGYATLPTAAQADSVRPWGAVEYIATGASGAFASIAPDDVLVGTIGSLKPAYRTNARWVMNRSTMAAVLKLRDSTGRPLVSHTIQEGEPLVLYGYPITIDDNVPDIGAGSLSIWFGDWRQSYCVARRPGVKLLRDPYSSKGHVMFYAYQRVGGGLVNSEALKAIRFAAS